MSCWGVRVGTSANEMGMINWQLDGSLRPSSRHVFRGMAVSSVRSNASVFSEPIFVCQKFSNLSTSEAYLHRRSPRHPDLL